MKKISANLTDENYDKIKKHKTIFQKDSIGRVTFNDSLNHLLEIAK